MKFKPLRRKILSKEWVFFLIPELFIGCESRSR